MTRNLVDLLGLVAVLAFLAVPCVAIGWAIAAVVRWGAGL